MWKINLDNLLHLLSICVDLRKSMEEKQLIYPASFLTLVAFSMVSYLVTSLMDPGYVSQKSNVNVEDGMLMENKVRLKSSLLLIPVV